MAVNSFLFSSGLVFFLHLYIGYWLKFMRRMVEKFMTLLLDWKLRKWKQQSNLISIRRFLAKLIVCVLSPHTIGPMIRKQKFRNEWTNDREVWAERDVNFCCHHKQNRVWHIDGWMISSVSLRVSCKRFLLYMYVTWEPVWGSDGLWSNHEHLLWRSPLMLFRCWALEQLLHRLHYESATASHI